MKRRELLQKAGLAAGAMAIPKWTSAGRTPKLDCVFQLSVITDEISQDFERALNVAANEFGVGFVELRGLWKKNIVNLDEKEVAEAKNNIILILENEYECNSGTGAEAARTLAAVPAKNFMINWDPGNAAALGEKAFPDGYAKVPKDRIGHMHLKDVEKKADGTFGWAAMGKGIIDYAEQFRAMMRDGYRGTMSLETHWNGGGTPEESSRISMVGTKELLRKAGALK